MAVVEWNETTQEQQVVVLTISAYCRGLNSSCASEYELSWSNMLRRTNDHTPVPIKWSGLGGAFCRNI